MENLSLIELKAMAYDELAQIQLHQKQLSDINALIQKKLNEQTKEVVNNQST
jgi:hypothetical protein